MIKRIVFSLLIVLSLGSGEVLARRRLANERKDGLDIYSIDRILKLNDKEIDIGTAALVLSRQWGTEKILRRYRDVIDDMAEDVLDRMNDAHVKGGLRAIRIMNKYLFEEKDFGSIKTADNPNDLFLHTVLEKKRGYCLSLSVLYLAVGERVGLDLHGVVVPGHFFVRYDDGRNKYNIETTSNGAIVPDKHYIEKFKPNVGRNSLYMKNLTPKQTLGCFFNNLGNSYCNVGDMDSASWALERAVEINPTLGEAHLNLGNMYLRNGWPDDAIRQYMLAKSLLPEDVKVYSNLANAYAKKGSLDEAEDHFNKALKIDPDFVEASRGLAGVYYKQGKVRQAIAMLVLIAKKYTNDKEVRYQLAEIYRSKKNYADAISYYKRASQLDRNFVGPYVGLGLCRMETGNLSQARTSFQKAVALDRNNVGALWGLAMTYNKLGKNDEELDAYAKLLAIEPNNGDAWMNTGSVYMNQKKYDKAVHAYEQAVRLKDEKSDIYYNIGVAYSEQENFEKSIEYYMAALQSDPKNATAYYNLAVSCFNIGEYKAAKENINHAKRLGFEVSSDIIEAIEKKVNERLE